VYLLVFHTFINEMHGSRSKIPSKKISSSSVVWRDLTPALKGGAGENFWVQWMQQGI
jgi:hypothetical protein